MLASTRLIPYLLALALFLTVAAPRGHAQSLLNGSFENPTTPAAGYLSGGGDNWTASGSYVFIVANGYGRGTTNAGNQWLYVRQSGTDTQTVSSGFTVGALYHFSLQAANVFPGTPDNLLVTITGGAVASQTFVIPNRTNAQTDPLPLTTYALNFTAVSAAPVTITIQDLDLNGGVGAVAVDSVSLGMGLTLVPEPSTWALLVTGVVALLGWHRRRAARA